MIATLAQASPDAFGPAPLTAKEFVKPYGGPRRSRQKKVRWLVETFNDAGEVVDSKKYTTQIAIAGDYDLCKETINAIYKGKINFDSRYSCHRIWLWKNKRISWIE